MSEIDNLQQAMNKGTEYTNVPESKKFEPTEIITYSNIDGIDYVHIYNIETKQQISKPLIEK